MTTTTRLIAMRAADFCVRAQPHWKADTETFGWHSNLAKFGTEISRGDTLEHSMAWGTPPFQRTTGFTLSFGAWRAVTIWLGSLLTREPHAKIELHLSRFRTRTHAC